ncbi:MAG: T9SS type A sorting domain-containing protein [Flavobacteriaceae bacterium]|nr:T9SS type A sorting domain-containing protein [Flavobacteriaceae bacterium]
MKFKYFVFLLFVTIGFSQNNQVWKDYFSYYEIVDVAHGDNKIFAATENSVFSKDLLTGNIDRFTSVNGFKPETVTCIYYSQTSRKLFAGNSNGLINIVDENLNMYRKVDIIEEVPVAPNKKRINHFYEYEGKLYIATDYGISVFDTNTLEFIETYFIGTSGEELKILQTTVFNNEIYAVTQYNGIRKADITSNFLYDFAQWQTFDSGSWTGILTFQNQLLAQNSNSRTYRHNGTAFQEILNTQQNASFFKTNDTEVIISTPNHIFVLNQALNTIAHVTDIPDVDNEIFSSATVVNNHLYVGTQKNGLYSVSLDNMSSFEDMTPNGPLRNYIFKIKQSPNRLWAVYGDYTAQFNPYPLDEYGISYYNNQGWTSFPYENLLNAKSIVSINFNPRNQNQVYFGSFYSGLLELQFADENFTLYDQTNTGNNGLETINSNSDIRVDNLTFDKDNNLWLTNGLITKFLKVMRTSGQWQSYDLSSYLATANYRFGDLKVDKNLTKWIATSNDGLLAFNDSMNNKFIKISSDQGLPSTRVNAVAIDNRNQMWIGTSSGLRILSSVDRFVQDTELSVTNIVIQEGDLAQELFYEQSILDIEVDGSNRKWVSISGGGVFLVSPNGQETIYKFDKENSPLPSNFINDIEINGDTGEVFFATDKGMVSFLGTSTAPKEDLSQVYVYPNPVRPNYSGTIKVAGLTDKCIVKITDIEGNLVHEVTSAGGTIEWDGTAFGKYKVASGVYMVFISTKDGMDTTVKKVMIIR